MTENELIKTPEEAIETIKKNMPTSGYQMLRESLNIAIAALKEIQQYRAIGTVEECREAADKQKQKKPKIHKDRFSNTYNCPKCSYVLIHRDETGWFCGQHYKFCPGCGQAIQWKESEEE